MPGVGCLRKALDRGESAARTDRDFLRHNVNVEIQEMSEDAPRSCLSHKL